MAPTSAAPYTHWWTITPASGFEVDSVTDAYGDTATDETLIEVRCPEALSVINKTIVGSHVFRARKTINLLNVTIGASAQVSFIAGEAILFEDLFDIEEGAAARFVIDTFAAECVE
jgi:hypothetical protein